MPEAISNISSIDISYNKSKPGYCNILVYSLKDISNGPSIILSKTDTEDAGSVIESSASWTLNKNYGVCSVEYAKIKDLPALYVYIKNSSGQISGIVRTFVTAPDLKKYKCVDENSLRLSFSPSKADRDIADSIEAAYSSEIGNVSWYYLSPHDYTIDLQAFGVFDDKADITLSMRYYAKRSNVTMRGLPAEDVSVLLKAPEVKSIELNIDGSNNRELVFDVLAKTGANLKVEILINNQPAVSANLDSNKKLALDSGAVSSYTLDERSNCGARLYYSNDKGCSRPSVTVPVVFEKPIVKFCRYNADTGIPVLTLADNGYYSYKTGDSTVLKQGPQIELAAGSGTVNIQKKINNFYGPKIIYTVSSAGYYSFKGEHGSFVQYALKPVSKPSVDVKISLGKTDMPLYENGSYFALTKSDNEQFLTMKAAAFDAENKDIRADYIKLIQECAKDYKSMELIRNAVKHSMPVPIEDVPFYYYGYDPYGGMSDLCAGMSLLIEYALYQNVPQTRDTDVNYQANGYAGTGTARYQVIARNGFLTFEPFIRGLTDCNSFIVPSPNVPDSKSILSGGSGINDLMFESFTSLPFIKLVYPSRYKSRECDEKDTRYYHNICLVGASDYKKLNEASDTVRNSAKVSIDGVYTNFRGRAAVIPQIQISVNGTMQWVSLGVTLGDVMDMMGIDDIAKIEFLRNTYPVNISERNMPLVIGDSVSVKRD